MLSDDTKLFRVAISGALLILYNTKPDDFHFRVVTCDEIWLYYYNQESKQESMEWKQATSPTTKTFKATGPPRIHFHDYLTENVASRAYTRFF